MDGEIWLLIFNSSKDCVSWEQTYWAQVDKQATDMVAIQWQCVLAVTHFT
jgi:hypothetical protein